MALIRVAKQTANCIIQTLMTTNNELIDMQTGDCEDGEKRQDTAEYNSPVDETFRFHSAHYSIGRCRIRRPIRDEECAPGFGAADVRR